MENTVAATGVAAQWFRFGFARSLAMAVWVLGLVSAPIQSAAGLTLGFAAEGGAPVELEELETIDPAELDALFEQAFESLMAGRYEASIDVFGQFLALEPQDLEAWRYVSQARIAIGRYDEAEEGLLAALEEAGDPPTLSPDEKLADAAWLDVAELYVVRGKIDEGLRIVDDRLAASPRDFRAGAIRGMLLDAAGRREESQAQFVKMHRLARELLPDDFEGLLFLAIAIKNVRGYSDSSQLAKELFDKAKDLEPANQRLFVERGRLYLEKYQSGDAINYEFRRALKVNPNLTGALLGLADAYIYRFQFHRAKAEVKRVLEINPNHPQAMLRRGFFEVDAYRFDQAKSWALKALAVNPSSREALAHLAAAEYLLENRKGYEKIVEKVLTLDPNYGDVYRIVADQVALLRRYEEARSICQKAIEVDPTNWLAMTSLGRYCFNTGFEDDGLKYLRRAQDNDPFRYAWRLNMIEVSRFFKQFITVKNPRFELKLHVDESPVMRDYLVDMLERAYAELTTKYSYKPPRPTVVEMFPKQSDFAVRTVGFEGIQGVLGACFGRVMTLNSPGALPPGSFVWARTVWHEFAHVVTLQLSDYRVPRWLTEGLSVYEEGSARKEWARDHDYDLVNAYANGKIMKILDLNEAFRSPRIIMAYFQSGLFCQYVADNFGFAKLVDMLKKYAEGLSTEQVFVVVLGRTVDELDADFLAHVEGIVSRFRVQPLYDRDTLDRDRLRVREDPSDFDAMIRVAAAYLQMNKVIDFGHYFSKAERLRPGDAKIDYWRGEERFRRGRYEESERAFQKAEKKGMGEFFLHHRFGLMAAARGKTKEAIARFNLAKEAFPTYLGPRDPYTELAKLYTDEGDRDAAMAEIKAYVDLVQEDFPNRMALASYLMDQGEFAEAFRYLEQAIYINPYDAEVHLLAGDCLRQQKDFQRAIQELEVARDLTEAEARIEVLRKLAEVYLEANRPGEARFELREILRLAPDDEEALQKLETIGE